MKNTKTKLISSVAVLLICFAMLIGSTFAWFTDSASTGVNKIQAGNQDLKMSVKNKTNNTTWTEVDENTKLFNIVDNTKWEPGVVAYEKFKVENVGNLALDYTLGFLPANVTSTPSGESLIDVIKVYEIEGNVTITDRASLLSQIPASYNFIDSYSQNNVRMNQNETKYFTIVLYWQPTDHDNDYNLSEPLKADLGIELVAKQATVERDSFDEQYDSSSLYPVHASINLYNDVIDTNGSNKVTNRNLIITSTARTSDNQPVAKVTIPSGVIVEDSANELKYTAEEVTTPNGVVVSSTNNSKTLEIDVIGLSDSNTTPIKIETNIGADLGDVTLQHVGSSVPTNKEMNLSDVDSDQDYHYDNQTGILTFLSSSFSPFVIEYPKELWSEHTATQALEPNEEGVYEIKSAEQLAKLAKMVNEEHYSFDGKTILLTSDINLDKYIWSPIKLDSNVVVFNGNNHTISGLNKPFVQNVTNSITINDLTISNSNISFDFENGLGTAAFVSFLDATPTAIFKNCHLINSSVVGNERAAGIVSYSSGSTLVLENCSVEKCEIESVGGAGGLVAYSQTAPTTFINSSVSKTSVTATEDRSVKHTPVAGGVIGTVAGDTTFTNVTVTDVVVSNINADPVLSEIIGRQTGGTITIN